MQKKFGVTGKYILVPVKTGMDKKTVSFYDESGAKIYEFEIPVLGKDANYDYLAAVSVEKWVEQTLSIEGDVTDTFMENISFSNNIPLNKEVKPMIHFSANYGWMNDPCGLIYQDGLYHLYYQHNPFDIEWGNMSWGHAVSRDLLHWEHREEALLPDGEGTIFTGSAIVNEQKLFNLPEDAHIYVYTSAGDSSKWSAGKKFVQKVAWSTDNGMTLHKMDGCIIDHMIGGNRDVKVYWHEKRQLYYAVMFLDGNEYAVLNSKDFTNWEVTQKLNLSPAWECPDLFEVPVEGEGTKWVFWTGDGFYFVGDFDGSRFESDFVLQKAYHTMLPYAAQTFAGTERIISVSWIRTNNKGKLYRSLMGIPRQLSLVKESDGYRLRLKMIDELEQTKEKIFEEKIMKNSMKDENAYIEFEKKEESAVELFINNEKQSWFKADIYGTKIEYKDHKIMIYNVAERSNGVKDAVKLGEKEIFTDAEQKNRIFEVDSAADRISVISDGEILEITVDDGIYAEVYETVIDQKKGMLHVETDGEIDLEIYQIK